MKRRTCWLEAAFATLGLAAALSFSLPHFMKTQCASGVKTVVETIARRIESDPSLRRKLTGSKTPDRSRMQAFHRLIDEKNMPSEFGDLTLPRCPAPVQYWYCDYGDFFTVFAPVNTDLQYRYIDIFALYSDGDGYSMGRYSLPEYHASNGLASFGLVHLDSYEMGWRRK
ncbi:MAG: hypothetical protein GC154_12065 [bacterium]|nr:hypothetical protein [bacterium]